MGGRLGGRSISIVGHERYARMLRVLHRDRRGVFEDANLSSIDRKALVKAMDTLIDRLMALQPKGCKEPATPCA